jgi:hypothetical protein
MNFALRVIAALLLGGCTLVSIEGDGNSVSDTGGHGGGVTLPSQGTDSSGPLQRFLNRPDQQ